MRIVVAADHGGIELKDLVARHLTEAGHQVRDLGTHGTESVDYPDFARPAAEAVSAGDADRAVLVCGTGQGMAMTANKVDAIRAAVVSDTFSARMAMAHNDARVLCLGQRVVGPGLALDIVDAWLATPFEGGRHERRVSKIG